MNLEFEVVSNDNCDDIVLEIWLDQNKFFECSAKKITQIATCELDDTPGNHTFEFLMRGKNSSHTELDKNGKIIKDVFFEISKLKIESIDLGQTFCIEGPCYFHNYNGHGPETVDEFYGVMGCNGTVKIPFSTPFLLWIMGINR